jgi:hypothetical protein
LLEAVGVFFSPLQLFYSTFFGFTVQGSDTHIYILCVLVLSVMKSIRHTHNHIIISPPLTHTHIQTHKSNAFRRACFSFIIYLLEDFQFAPTQTRIYKPITLSFPFLLLCFCLLSLAFFIFF